MRPKPLEQLYEINTDTDCWEWLGYIGAKGYANYKYYGKMYKAHRFVYEKYKGKIPQGLVLDHLCKNRKCVNPEHLEAVEMVVNSRRGNAYKVTQEQVLEIIEKYKTGKYLQRELALEYGIVQTQISKIILGVSHFSFLKEIKNAAEKT